MLTLEPVGFEHAGVTRAFLMVSVAASVALSAVDWKRAEGERHAWAANAYRFVANSWLWDSAVEMFVGSLVVYLLRGLERRMGSSAYGTFFALSFLLYSLAAVPLWFLLGARLPKGPYFLVFSLLALCHALLPPLRPLFTASELSSMPPLLAPFLRLLSDKSLLYALALQLSLADWPSSLWAALIGFSVGLLYLSPILSLRGYSFSFFESFSTIFHFNLSNNS